MRAQRRRAVGPAALFLAAILPAIGAASLDPSPPAVAAPEEGAESPLFVELDRLNEGLPPLDPPADLRTPQSALENFILSCEAGDDRRAARSLDLNDLAPARQAEEGPRLARQLKAVMDQQVWVDWDAIPDRPDGADDEAHGLASPEAAPAGPRANLLVGRVHLGDRDVEVRLERVKVGEARPIWVVSRRTVRHIPELYRAFGPSRLELAIPRALRETRLLKIALWQWIGFAVIVAAGALLGWGVEKLLDLLLRWQETSWARTLADAIRGPGSLTIGLATAHELASRYLGLAGPVSSSLEPVYLAVLIGGGVWFLQRLIRIASTMLYRRYEGRVDDGGGDPLLTRIAVVSHVLTVAVVFGGGLYALSYFEWFRQIGPMLLASAGVAGVVLGIAAQRVLGNLCAGLLLAITQPVRAGDAILFEGEFGWIEEIDLAYIVIRIWDLRRVVVPITYFMDHPVQNWSRRSQNLMFPVYLHADYRADLEALRAELKAALEGSEHWDRQTPPMLQVTSCTSETIELRALCGAPNPGAAWNLQCLVRERLTAVLRDLDGGRYLPRRRVVLAEEAAGPDGDAERLRPAGEEHPEAVAAGA